MKSFTTFYVWLPYVFYTSEGLQILKGRVTISYMMFACFSSEMGVIGWLITHLIFHQTFFLPDDMQGKCFANVSQTRFTDVWLSAQEALIGISQLETISGVKVDVDWMWFEQPLAALLPEMDLCERQSREGWLHVHSPLKLCSACVTALSPFFFSSLNKKLLRTRHWLMRGRNIVYRDEDGQSVGTGERRKGGDVWAETESEEGEEQGFNWVGGAWAEVEIWGSVSK